MIAYGGVTISNSNQFEQRYVTVQSYPNDIRLGPIYLPSVYTAYRISASFREDQAIRLASGNIYLSNLDQERLPSRAKRCLKESIDAYRYGLYLSATMAAGAASESLWMKLASLIRNKRASISNEIGKQLDRVYPSIYSVIKETWQVVVSHFDPELKQIFPNNGERTIFRDHANRLCYLRNYAMHKEEADEDEPFFTRYETVNLLLASIKYFNELTKLVAAIENLP